VNQLQEQQLNELLQVLSLKDHPGWQIIMRDAQANFDSISNLWFHYKEDDQELRQLRARQIANQTMLGLMGLYEAKFNEVSQEVVLNEDSKLIQTTDVESGIAEEEQDGE
jgi:hypothetical protein